MRIIEVKTKTVFKKNDDGVIEFETYCPNEEGGFAKLLFIGSVDPFQQEVVEDVIFQGYKGYTKVELENAFDKVKDKEDWKNPIKAEIHQDYFAVCNAACEFFTGTALKISHENYDTVFVYAVGYRAGPAGDH